MASHPHAAGAHGPAKHFTDEQWAALKLPEDNVNAGSHNKKIDHIKELSEGGHVTGLLGLGIGSNTYGKKQALVINHLLGLHGSAHKVTAGQKAGEHPAVQSAEPATPHPTGLPEHLAPKTTTDLQEPGPLAPLAQHVKDTLDEKAAEGNVDFLKMVAANNPELPQIVAYAQQKLAELDGKAPAPAAAAGPSLPPGAKLSTDVNASPLVHTTTPEAAAAIQKDGFKPSGNSMYGKGVYFSSAAQSDAYGSAVLGAKLKPHKQLVLAKDSDVSKAFTALTGLSSGHLGSDKGAQAMIDAGVGSMVFPVDDETYTVVFDPGLIDVQADAAAGPLTMPEFQEGKTTTGVKAYYEKVAQKIIDHGHAGNASVLADMKADGLKPNAKGKTTNTWLGKTANSKKLLALHAAALEHATGAQPAPTTTASSASSGDPFAGMKLPAPVKDYLLKPSVTMKDGSTVTPKEFVDSLLEEGYGNPEYFASPKGSQAGFLTKPGKPKVTLNDKQLFYADAAFMAKKKAAIAAAPKEGDTKPAADGGTLVLKDGHWVKQGGDEAAAVKPEHFEVSPGDVFKLDSQYQKMNAGEWVVYNVSADGAQVYMHKVGAKVPNQTNSATIPAATLAEAVAKGTAKKQGAAAPAPTVAPAVTPETGKLTAQQLSNLQSIPWYKLKLPPENTNAKSHNAALAKIEAMAFAGDTAGLQVFIDAKSGAKQTYAKKQVLTAQTALAGLQQPGATAAVPVEPSPAKPASPLLSGVSADSAIASFKATSPHASLADFEAKWKEANAGKVGLNAEWAMAANPAPAAPPPAAHFGPKEGDTKQGADGMLVLKDGRWVKMDTGDDGPGDWAFSAGDPAFSGANTIGNHEVLIAFSPGDGAELHTNASMEAGYGEPELQAHTVHELVQKMAAAGHSVPPLSMLKKLDTGYEPPAAATPPTIKKLDLLAVNFILQTLPPSLVPQAKFSVNHASKMALTAAKTGDAAGMAAAYSKALDLGYEKTGGHIKAVAEAMGVDTSKWDSESVATAAAAPAPAAKPAANNLPSMDSWIQTGPQGGSNPGGRFKDADGVEWYCKFPPDESHARSEVLAAKLYEAAGLKSQDAKLVTKGGKVGIASRWVDVKKVGAEGLKDTPGALGGFVVDAWLANWDVVGMGYDNLQVGSDGRAVRVDAGGSLQYRAQGAAKPFGHKVEEIKTMRDPKKNPQAAAVFGALTAADMTASAKKVLSISDDQIHDLVMAHGPGDVAKKAELIDALIARKEDIAKQFPKAVPKEKVKPKPDPTKLKVSADQLPKPHDFKNWKGAGSGLSSKAHVNEANQAAEQALLDTALKGNLIALKDYHFDALDKETGAVVGKKPISEHPSNHVKTYWSDLVSTLSFIAYPPEALKKFKSVVATSITKVSDAFKAAKYGTTTKGVEANSRLAFWIALGNTKPAESLLPPGASLDFQSSPTGQPKVTPAMTEQAKAAYQALNSGRPVKRFINGIQSSGSYNDNFRDGRMVTTDGWDAAAMALDAYGYATEKPEGFELYKWISFPGDMGKQMLSAPPGTVFQNPGSMCCSTGPTGTAGFGADRVRIRYAKGAKAVDSFGSGNFPGEKEITTLPGQRFVILKCHKVMCPVKGKERIELDVLMLPPDPTYVAELEAMKGNHGGKS